MSKSRKKKKPPKRVLALPDLEQAKSAVLNTLTSRSGQRTYDHAINEFVEWYCLEPRLAFNRTVVLQYRISLEIESASNRNSTRLQRSTYVSRQFAELSMRQLIPVCQSRIGRRHTPSERSSSTGDTSRKLAYR